MMEVRIRGDGSCILGSSGVQCLIRQKIDRGLSNVERGELHHEAYPVLALD